MIHNLIYLLYVQDVSTRWSSTLNMIQRLLANKDAVIQSLALHRHNVIPLAGSEWNKLSGIQKLLEPCEKASKILGGEKYVTISVVLPILAYLRREMTTTDDDPGYARKFKEAFYLDL